MSKIKLSDYIAKRLKEHGVEHFFMVSGGGAMHLNDSMNPMGSHKDRHQKIGQGSIGTETFAKIINHEKLQGIPCYLETPNELPGYAEEIALLKSLYHQA